MRVDVDMSVTLRLGPLERNQYLRVGLSYHDLDPELALEEQIAHGEHTAQAAFASLLGEVRKRVKEVRSNGQYPEA